MKRKLFVVLLLGALLTSCNSVDSSKETIVANDTNESAENNLTLKSIKEEKNDDNVELVIPSNFVDATTQEELDNIVKEKGFVSAKLNSDGSATYIISKSKHKELMKEIKNEINSSLSELIGSEECPNVIDIKANTDFTHFSVTTTSTELSLEETFSVMIFYTYGGMYNIFNGTPVNNVHLDFINKDSGDIIDSFDSSEMGNIEESPQESQSSEIEECGLGDTWTVDGQWSLTINEIHETEERNEYSDKNPAQVFIIDYIYENIGYEDSNGIMDGLYFDLESEQIIDSDGFMGYSYSGDTTYYSQETPIGAKCRAQSCVAVDNQSSEIKISVSKYDGTDTEQKCIFVLPIE